MKSAANGSNCKEIKNCGNDTQMIEQISRIELVAHSSLSLVQAISVQRQKSDCYSMSGKANTYNEFQPYEDRIILVRLMQKFMQKQSESIAISADHFAAFGCTQSKPGGSIDRVFHEPDGAITENGIYTAGMIASGSEVRAGKGRVGTVISLHVGRHGVRKG